MSRLVIVVVSLLVALALGAPDAEARGGHRGGGGGKSRSHHASAATRVTKPSTPKSSAAEPSMPKKARKASQTPVRLHVHLPAAKAAKSDTTAKGESKAQPPLQGVPAQDQARAAAPQGNGINELCLLPVSDPKRPPACAQLEDWPTWAR